MATIAPVLRIGIQEANGSPSAAGLPSDQLSRQDFLQLLILQLRNQDPLDPIDDREFIAQMAQLSTLEATTGLSRQVQQLVGAQQQTQALQMVGRNVEFASPSGQPETGTVTGVRLDSVPPMLVIGDRDVPLTWVRTVL